jgi:hypothetical protein
MAETWDKLIYEKDYDKGRRAILTPAGAIVPATAGAEQKQSDGTNFSYYTLNFDKDAEESAFWEFCLPDDYDGGTILVNLWWKSSATSGDAVFKVQVLGREEGETLDAALGSAQSVTDTTPASAGNIAVCAPMAFSPSWVAGDYVVIKLARDATNVSDTLAVDAEVIMVVVEY